MTAAKASDKKTSKKPAKAVKPAAKPAPKAESAKAAPKKPAAKPVAKPEVAKKPAAKPVEVKVAPKPAPAKSVTAKPAPAKPATAKKAPVAKKPVVAKAKRGTPVAHGIGRRKAAVARVWLRRGGTGALTINSRPVSEYFDTEVARRLAQIPLTVVPTIAARYDYDINVFGGGVHGQADAVKLAISRALVKADETSRVALKEQGFLKVDSRVVERKKYGQKKARRKFQFVKR